MSIYVTTGAANAAYTKIETELSDFEYLVTHEPDFIPEKSTDKKVLKALKLKKSRYFLSGNLKDNYRSNENLLEKSVITIDYDDLFPLSDEEFKKVIHEAISEYNYLLYPTASYREDNLRYRLVLDSTRNYVESENKAVIEFVTDKVSLKYDPSSISYSQQQGLKTYLTGTLEEYEQKVVINRGKALPIDEILAQILVKVEPVIHKKEHSFNAVEDREAIQLITDYTSRNEEWLQERDNYLRPYMCVKHALQVGEITKEVAEICIQLLAGENQQWQQDNVNHFRKDKAISKLDVSFKEFFSNNKPLKKQEMVTLEQLKEVLIERGIQERTNREYPQGKGENAEIKKPRLTPLEVAHVLQDYLDFIIIGNIENPVSVFLIEEGIYTIKESYFFRLISWVENTLTERLAKTVIFHLKNESEVKEKYTGSTYICVGNGLFNFETKQLEPYNPEIIFTSKINTNYMEMDSKPMRYDWTFSNMIKEWSNNDSELEALLWQIVRASIQLKNREQFVLLRDSGMGRSGKGTFQEFISSIVGKDNTMPLTVKEMQQSHQTEGIESAQIVIGDDNDPSSFVDEPRVLKSLVTGDMFSVNPKGSKRFKYQGTPLVIQSVNGHLRTSDITDAFKRRMLIVPFVKSFKGNKGNPKIKSEYARDPEILSWIMYHALQIEDFTLFIQPKVSENLMREFTLENDIVADFFENIFLTFKSGRLRVDFVYKYFVKWSQEVGKPSKLSQRMFVTRLNQFIEKTDDWSHSGQTAISVLDYFKQEDNDKEGYLFLQDEITFDDKYRKARKTCYVNPTNELQIDLEKLDLKISEMKKTNASIKTGRSNFKALNQKDNERELKDLIRTREKMAVR